MPQWISELITASPFLGGIAAAGFILLIAAKYLKPPSKGIEHFLEDWNGEPERPGVPARPGMMQRMAALEAFTIKYSPVIDRLDHEMHPNSGGSLADAVNRTEAAMKAHIESCPAIQTNVTVTTPGT